MNGDQSRMARAALKLSIREAAEAAKVSTQTINRLEGGEALRTRTVEDIRRVYESMGIVFFDVGEELYAVGPGVYLQKVAPKE